MNHLPFHLAFPVDNLDATRAFYEGVLECPVGRESAKWIDFNFFGNQITAHLRTEEASVIANQVDSIAVPVPHFGAIVAWAQFPVLAERLREAKVAFIHEPRIRFRGKIGEQATLFVRDPSGNALEFKSFKDPTLVFARAVLQES